ncbi:hypothetical protein QQP08_022890 [Theobroma cacao]|nr:hypothetical protein QQP08_022890 [Theobroma cacao]
MQPVTRGAYGGGMYGNEEQGQTKRPEKPPASETQSADGPDEARYKPVNKPPPSSGDRDIDITGQSYIHLQLRATMKYVALSYTRNQGTQCFYAF